MDLRKIKKLIELVEESGIAELEVKSGEEAVRITMAPPGGVPGLQAIAVNPAAGVAATPLAESEPPTPNVAEAVVGKPLNAPLSGTFYAAPSPEDKAFVQVGDLVRPGDVLCIVESMKMMNRIEADRAGTVSAVMVPNGEPVEAGQALFLIE